MSTSIEKLTLAGVLHVVQNMRLSDWEEVINCTPAAYQSVDGIAILTMQFSGSGFVVRVDDQPAAVVQLVERHKGSWSVGMYATDDFGKCWRTIIKEVRAVLFPQLLELEARYVEAHVLATNWQGMRLLESVEHEILTKCAVVCQHFRSSTKSDELEEPHSLRK